MSNLTDKAKDIVNTEAAALRGAAEGQVSKVETKFKDKFNSFLASNPKKLILTSLLVGLVLGLFFGAVAGVQLATSQVNVVQGGGSADDMHYAVPAAQPKDNEWTEFKPAYGAAQGNG